MHNDNLYTSGQYQKNNPQWHSEDSPWKVKQIYRIIEKNRVQFQTVVDIGCGAGTILDELAKKIDDPNVSFKGYDVAAPAIEMAQKIASPRVNFEVGNLLDEGNQEQFGLLLAIDVFEHVPDYMGFLEKCRHKAKYQIYHIPLDIHISSVIRNTFIRGRHSLGHLHYFTAESALATLKDTGHEIVDFFYTDGALSLFEQHPSFKRAVANVPRRLLSKVSVPLTARILGGYSLLVLTK